MQNNNSDIYKELPYYLSSNNYRPSFKISRRRVLPYSNIDNYRTLIGKSNLENTYFYTESLQKIIKTSLKINK